MKYGSRLLGALGAVMALLMTGCATEMTPQQKDAAELRRYCETTKNDTVKCLGFYGFL